jgi:staphylococcal nuclease domain-containing protein 1
VAQLFLPKQDTKITLVLLGIRAPRTARNANEKSEPFGAEGYDYVVRKALQRDAEVEIDSTDKSGGGSTWRARKRSDVGQGFIGTLYLNKSENLAVSLVKEGYAHVSDYGADRVPFAKQLQEAEADAKQAHRNVRIPSQS